ncbi:hypothetical protein SAMN05660653_02105 [Desulfonatronum thiosulfatophilum]|uniref:Uncharacterized protein n=1 Tax=Desulfonatronum thiosulfatophilum TaxID=617002 RepID=A0A1G6DE78_9BACT|nr:hypothetical protein SAMN05660653_02105 [Desulfonatronum thiosulfatophilum]
MSFTRLPVRIGVFRLCCWTSTLWAWCGGVRRLVMADCLGSIHGPALCGVFLDERGLGASLWFRPQGDVGIVLIWPGRLYRWRPKFPCCRAGTESRHAGGLQKKIELNIHTCASFSERCHMYFPNEDLGEDDEEQGAKRLYRGCTKRHFGDLGKKKGLRFYS